AEREPVPLGRRAGAVGPVGQLPAEREHQDYRRPGAEDRSRDAEDQELRPEVLEGDQGNPRRDGPLARHEAGELAAQAADGPGPGSEAVRSPRCPATPTPAGS